MLPRQVEMVLGCAGLCIEQSEGYRIVTASHVHTSHIQTSLIHTLHIQTSHIHMSYIHISHSIHTNTTQHIDTSHIHTSHIHTSRILHFFTYQIVMSKDITAQFVVKQYIFRIIRKLCIKKCSQDTV